MSENVNQTSVEETTTEQFSLNDDRRVKVLSPGAMVAKRFFRNRLAVTGLGILIFMFIFSFVGGMVSPYAEDEVFYRVDYQKKEYAAVIQNEELRFASAETDIKFDGIVQAQTMLAIQKKTQEFSYKDVDYTVLEEGKDFTFEYKNNSHTEDAFLFSIEADVDSVTVVLENVNPDRSTLIFEVLRNGYMNALNAIYTFIQGGSINKRSEIRSHQINFKDHGIIRYRSVNHDDFYTWKFGVLRYNR